MNSMSQDCPHAVVGLTHEIEAMGARICLMDTGVITVNDAVLKLTPAERTICTRIIQAEGKVCTYRSIVEAIYNTSDVAAKHHNCIKAQISRLRNKLEELNSGLGSIITTVRGIGFVIHPKYYRTPNFETQQAFSLVVGDTTFTFTEQNLCFVNGAHVPLAARQYEILRMLVELRGKVCTFTHLSRVYYTQPAKPQSDSFKVLVCRIRERLAAHTDATLIETVHGRGYRITYPLPAPVLDLSTVRDGAYAIGSRGQVITVAHLPSHTVVLTKTHMRIIVRLIETAVITRAIVRAYYPDVSAEELEDWMQQFGQE